MLPRKLLNVLLLDFLSFEFQTVISVTFHRLLNISLKWPVHFQIIKHIFKDDRNILSQHLKIHIGRTITVAWMDEFYKLHSVSLIFIYIKLKLQIVNVNETSVV